MSQIEHEVSSGNVYADLGFQKPAEARAKAELAWKITALIERKGFDQAAAARLLGVDPADFSRLLEGQLSEFPMEVLMGFMLKLDQDVEIRVKEHRSTGASPGIEVVAS